MPAFNKAAFFAANKKNKENRGGFTLPTPGLYLAKLKDAWYKKFESGGEGFGFVWQTYDEDDNAFEKATQIQNCINKDGKQNEVGMAIAMSTLEKLGVDLSDEENFDIDKALQDVIDSEVRLKISHTDSDPPYAKYEIKRVVLASASSTGIGPKETSIPQTQPAKSPSSNQPPTNTTQEISDDGSELKVGDILEYSDRQGSYYAQVCGINEQKEEILALRLDTKQTLTIKPYQCSPLSSEQQAELRAKFQMNGQQTQSTSSETTQTVSPETEVEVDVEIEPQFEVGMNVNYLFKGEKLVGKIHKYNDPEGTVVLIDAGTQKGRQVAIDKISHLI